MIAALAHDPVLDLVLRGALATLFASAAVHKLRDRVGFREVVRAYRLLPASLVVAAAPAIATVELGLAFALLAPWWRVGAALGAAAVLAAYAGAIAVNLLRGRREIDCGCGAPGTQQPISEWLLVRNALLVVAALLTLAPPAGRPLLWIDWLALAGGLAVLSCAWNAAHGLAAASFRARSWGAS